MAVGFFIRIKKRNLFRSLKVRRIDIFITLSIFYISLFLVQCSTEKKYVKNALKIIEEKSINSDSINWPELKKETFAKISGTTKSYESYDIIKDVLDQLNDQHSFFMTPGMAFDLDKDDRPIPTIKTEMLSFNIAYIKVPGFIGNKNKTINFASKIKSSIRELDNLNPNGWIIDLSSNFGGNMWPMLLGLGPLLGEGTLGYFKGNEEMYLPWIYKDGKIFQGTEKILEVENFYLMKNDRKKIAILIGEETASSGEAAAISFIGKENTMFFGYETAGLTSANEMFVLEDGAQLFLTVSRFADRNKQLYLGKIKPDRKTNLAKKEAADWIRTSTN